MQANPQGALPQSATGRGLPWEEHRLRQMAFHSQGDLRGLTAFLAVGATSGSLKGNLGGT